MPITGKHPINWLSDQYYHLYNHGTQDVPVFRDEVNYYFVLIRMKQSIQEFELAMIAYCLMPDHYHMLVRQMSETPAGLLPQRVFNSYTKAYNHRYAHRGSLFEGRHKAVQVVSASHLRNLCRYIHAEPVKNGIVETPRDWYFSNYLDCIGLRTGAMVDLNFISKYFGDSTTYRNFVEDIQTLHHLPSELAYLS